MSTYRKVQLYFECSEEMTEFITEMCEATYFMDAGITFTDEGSNREVDTRFWLVGETNAIIMGVNAIPFGPPIGVIVFLTVPEDMTPGEINNFTPDGPEFGINLGRPDDFAESWVFFAYSPCVPVPMVWEICLGYGGGTDRLCLLSTKTACPSAVLMPSKF